MLRKIVIGFTAAIVLFLVIGLFLPSKMRVEQSVVINASIEKVFPEVGDLKNWDKWTTWAESDRDAIYTYSETSTGKNAFMKWDGKIIGKGELTFTDYTENQNFAYTLYFPDFSSTSTGGMTLSSEGNGTKVTWKDENDFGYNIMMRYLAVFFMKDAIEQDFAKGLANLKKVCEG